MTQQMVLGFPVEVNYAVDAFMPLPGNEALRQAVAQLLENKQGQLLVIGPMGTGKTHGLHVVAASFGAAVTPATEVSTALLDQPVVIIDDIEHLTPAQDEVLFHLLQRQEGVLILSTGINPQLMERLPDVASRLRVMPRAVLAAFDDQTLELMALKLAGDAQLVIRPEVLAYLMKHAERSPAALATLIKQLDALSLQEKRAITLPLVRKVLHDAI